MMNIDRVYGNIIDQIKEAQIKLGYVKETVRLYYPVAELARMLGMEEVPDAQEMSRLLNEAFLERCVRSDAAAGVSGLHNQADIDALGEIQFSVSSGRIEVSIPPEGVEYVHRFVPASKFLTDIIHLFGSNHHAAPEEIRAVFEKYSKSYICRQMKQGSDFDYVIYFSDSSIDEYCYCIKTEMGHTIYHRFTREAYLLNGWEL